MLAHAARPFIAVLVLTFASLCQGQSPGKVDLEAAEIAAEFIGAPVFAADGSEVGKVADISFDDEGQARKLRMEAAAHLGLGTRTIEVPWSSFMALRGAVVLDLPPEALQELPELTQRSDEK
jgi:sporulation protein YlmC with PRC-barrel domain